MIKNWIQGIWIVVVPLFIPFLLNIYILKMTGWLEFWFIIIMGGLIESFFLELVKENNIKNKEK